MEGGMNAWKGLAASGPPEAGMAYFPDNAGPEEIIGLAWLLEEGARRFYKGIEEMIGDRESIRLFKELGAAEVRHKSMLLKLHRDLSGPGADPEFPGSFASKEMSEVMEGGMHVGEALKWAKGKDLMEIIDFSIALETNSYDLYLKMERRVNGNDTKKIFKSLSDEEKIHLNRLTSLLEKRL